MTKANRFYKLLLCLFLDAMGYLSYLVPFIGEGFDVLWAPVSSAILFYMFGKKEGGIAAIINLIEESSLGFDFIPTFTLTWIYTTYIKK
ncbi:MAG: hypothetical protein ACPGEC_04590 [Flavobacteriales bacterium]